MTPEARIRPLAIGLLIWHDHLLAARARDEAKDETFYRPIGGGIEFGERAAETLAREFREELGREIEVVELTGTAENLFTYEGAPGHEIVLEYLVRWVRGGEPKALEPLEGVDEAGNRFEAVWLPLAEVIAGTHRVYPDGLPDRLAEWFNRL